MKGIAKKIILVAVVLTSAVGSFSPTSAESPKLVQFHMALLKKGPKWTDKLTNFELSTDEMDRIHRQHLAYASSLLESGKAIIAGPLSDGTEVLGVFIFRAQSAGEAQSWAETDPAVKAGYLVAEMHPWWSEDIFKKANLPVKLETVYLGFLKKGPNRKDGDDKVPEIQELQKAHIANIQRLAKLGKLVAAGPFGDDGVVRGIFVFRVGSLAEAQKLCATDPMVKIGRLAVELHSWQVPEGVLP
jgi:uncharacterized protein YciI